MGRVNGKIAIVTGAARGQGEAEARLLAREGAKVVVSDILEERGMAVAADIGDSAVFERLDVSSQQDWNAVVSGTVEQHGKVDILVNNAAMAYAAPFTATPIDDYQRLIEVNQIGVVMGMQSVIPHMPPGGSIVNISSIDGLVGTPYLSAYVSTKFAVRGITKSASLELAARGIRVNSVHPGAIDTEMLKTPGVEDSDLWEQMLQKIPMARAGESEEVAHLVLFLASDESSYCTGSEFIVDGGMTAGTYFPISAE